MLISFSLMICSGTSSVALAWSGTFDDLIGGVISKYLEENAPMGLTGLAPYPDVFAAGLILILSGTDASKLLSTHLTVKATRNHRYTLCSPWRSVSLRSEGVNHNKQDLYGNQHPGAAVCHHFRIHQGGHLQLENQSRGFAECNSGIQVMLKSGVMLFHF